tara:strand:+ start:3069 stop:4622 length:1554 start_codon:yes stop_codon:yes gene_type:complete
MKKIMLLIALCFGLSADSSATHIVGGDVHFAQTGPNTFVVTTRWFRYCQGSTAGAPTSITTRIFDNVTNASVTSITMQRDSFVNIVFGDECYTPPGLCVEVHYYSATVTLANNPNGYYSSYNTCCRNGSIVNVSTNSNVWTAQIPDPALAGGNTSPLFVQYPQDGYFCIGFDKAIDFSCFDFDGDSLVYTLVNPFNNLGPGGARPFSLLGWQAGYNLANILGPGTQCVINSATGIVTARPAQLGLFVISVRCDEYRNGVKIGHVYRDIQMSALNCTYNTLPTFENFPTISSFTFDEDGCFDVVAVDQDPEDTFFIQILSNAFQFGATASLPAANSTGRYDFSWKDGTTGGTDTANNLVVRKLNSTEFEGIGRVGARFCWNLDQCEILAVLDSFYVEVLGFSIGCDDSRDTVRRRVVLPVTEPVYDYNTPNVFSPDGDGINDLFYLKQDAYDRCYDALNIRIYNRWGQQVFQSDDAKFTWDGNDESGAKLSPGTYYIVLQGFYGGKEVTQNYPVTLFR